MDTDDALGSALETSQKPVFLVTLALLAALCCIGAGAYLFFFAKGDVSSHSALPPFPKEKIDFSVGSASPSANTSSIAGLQHVVSVNTASLAELDELPGIGQVRAQQIIDGRPYTSLDELTTKAKLPRSVVEKIQGMVGL